MVPFKSVSGKTTQTSVALIFRFKENLSYTQLSRLGPLTDEGLVYNIEKIRENNKRLMELLENTIESKNESNQSIEILLIQRAKREGDPHSGQIAYPGGKNDNEELDYETVVREVQEEVGLELNDEESFIFLGKIPRNFFVYFRKDTAWMVSVHLFFVLNNATTKKISISEQEVEKLFWCPLNRFVSFEEGSIFEQEMHRKPSDVFTSLPLLKKYYFDRILKDSYSFSKFSHFRLRNGEIFYGLSFQIMLHVVKIMNENLINDSRADLAEIEKTKIFLKAGFSFQLVVKRSPFCLIHYKVLNHVYHKKRFSQFINSHYPD